MYPSAWRHDTLAVASWTASAYFFLVMLAYSLWRAAYTPGIDTPPETVFDGVSLLFLGLGAVAFLVHLRFVSMCWGE